MSMKTFSSPTNHNQGAILPVMLVVLLFLLSIGLTLVGLALNQLEASERSVAESNGLLTAEAGIEKTIVELNNDDTFGGFTSEQEFFNNADQGMGTYETVVEDGNIRNEKIIHSTGRVYDSGSSSEPRITRYVETVVVGTTTENYSVRTGPGGLIMSNSATIANGDVHVNGFIDMSNQSRIGSETNPTRVDVAHIYCPEPPDDTFPEQCGSDDGEPISIQNPAHIYADVYANNQQTEDGMSHNGLVSSSGVEEKPLPDTERPSQKQTIEDEGQNITASSASCTQNNHTETWPANTRITGGDVEISHSCEVILEGDIWISDGGLIMRNSGNITVSEDVTQQPSIMVDGANGVSLQNSSTIIANGDGYGVDVVTYWSDTDCSPDCDDVTGVELYDSQSQTTIDLDNSGLAAGSNFYARWSKVIVDNGGSVGSVLGQTVELRNSGNISFGEELSSGESVWSVVNYQRVFE